MYTTILQAKESGAALFALKSENRNHMRILHILAKENNLVAETTVEVAARVVTFKNFEPTPAAAAKKDAKADIKANAKSY